MGNSLPGLFTPKITRDFVFIHPVPIKKELAGILRNINGSRGAQNIIYFYYFSFGQQILTFTG